jgi:HD-GYP domain-containing protein (c-di-GMP phosphodiesterase class II)
MSGTISFLPGAEAGPLVMSRHDATGTAGREQLIADLDRRGSSPTRLELIVFRDGDGLDSLLDAPDETRERVDEVLVAAARRHRAALYRLDASIHALVSPDRGPSQTAAAAVRAGVREISEIVATGMVHGDAVMAADAVSGADALRVALDRLRARGRLSGRSAERQVRDVLLQLLSECRPDSSRPGAPPVAAHAVAVGRHLGMELGQLDVLVRAAELQDLGKLAIPDSILTKTTPLSADEWQVIRRHPVVGERILSATPALEPVARLVRSCSERFDGSGYPDGLRGDEIPLGSRVIAVCVAYHAMTSQRPYRSAMAEGEAFGELFRGAGIQFDPMVVAAFCAVVPGR